MARRAQREPNWKAEAFVCLNDRLRSFESSLQGRRLLELHCSSDISCSFLLDWLRPSRLVAVDVGGPALQRLAARAGSHSGESPSFDAAFLFARHELMRAVEQLRFPEVARVLSPSGLLIVTAFGPRSWATQSRAWEAELDGTAQAWGILHASLARAGFRVTEEHLGTTRLLVARRDVPTRTNRVQNNDVDRAAASGPAP